MDGYTRIFQVKGCEKIQTSVRNSPIVVTREVDEDTENMEI